MRLRAAFRLDRQSAEAFALRVSVVAAGLGRRGLPLGQTVIMENVVGGGTLQCRSSSQASREPPYARYHETPSSRSACDIRSPMRRATVSVPPPAA